MLGFKRFETAAITISGIELAEKIRKHQFKTGKLAGKPKTAPEIWAADRGQCGGAQAPAQLLGPCQTRQIGAVQQLVQHELR